MTGKKVYVDEEGWVHCPICSGKSRTKVKFDTVLQNFPLFCPKCGRETIINLIQKTEPDAKTRSR